MFPASMKDTKLTGLIEPSTTTSSSRMSISIVRNTYPTQWKYSGHASAMVDAARYILTCGASGESSFLMFSKCVLYVLQLRYEAHE
jgi:hypothetical protein